MKKLIKTLALATALIFAGCAGSVTTVETKKVRPVRSKTVLINGSFYESSFEQFMKETEDPRIKHYTLRITSSGGDAYSCTGMISRILELKKRGVTFTTITYTKAFSAGAFIFMMGDNRIMHQGSQLMFHTVSSQYAYEEKDLFANPYADQARRTIFPLDENIERLTLYAMDYLPEATVWALLYSGPMFITATDAYELGIATELIKTGE